MTGLLNPLPGRKVTQDFGPGIPAEPDNLYIQQADGKWLRGRPTPFVGGVNRKDIHLGTDISAPKGTPVLAPEAGIVRAHSWDDSSGNTIIVEIRPGTCYGFLHLSKFIAPVGARVKRGEAIARVGSTGLSTGPHAHWWVRHYIGAKPNWRRYYSLWFAYDPERLLTGGDMAGVSWIRPA